MSKASLELGGTNWAAKDGNLLGYANGSFVDRYIPREFTFSRGSNLAATRINSAGKIEKGRENLLLQSNAFSTSPWNDGGDYTITGGQDGYDGTTDAWVLQKNTTGNDYLLQSSLSTDAVNTISFYAKEGSVRGVKVVCGGQNVVIDLRDGSTISTGGASGLIAAGADLVSGATDWYRVYMTKNITTTSVLIKPTNENGADTSGFIYIQDAQLEVGLVATNYIESGATTATAGLLENEPRIDYTDGTPSLLLEPQRVQLMPQSEYFDSYVKSDTSILTNQAQSPEGLVNASLVAETATNSNHYLGLTTGISVVSGTTYTFSVFVKKGDGATAPDYCQLTFNFAGFGAVYANFNLSNGTIGTSSGVTPLISDSTINGFWRCSITATATSTANTGAIVAFTNNNDSLGRLPSYLGNTASDFYAYGFQVEEAPYPTSYIPNHSGGSVTRTADLADESGLTANIGQTEGTIFLEVKAPNVNSDIIGVNRSVTDGIQIFKNVSNFFRAQIYAGGTGISLGGTTAITDTAKVALVYKSGDSSLFVNGVQVQSSATTFTFSGALDRVQFMGNFFAGIGTNEIKQTLFFPTALSDADCITLTT